MVQLLPILTILGEQFSPRRAEEMTGLTFSRKAELGEVGLQGAYKGRPLPHGVAFLEVPTDVVADQRLTWLVDRTAEHLPTFQRLGASQCTLHLEVRYQDQCNLEFDPELLARIASLGLTFTISCWDATEQGDLA